MFCKKDALKNLAIFTGIHLCWRFFLTNFIKKRLQHRCFLVMMMMTMMMMNCFVVWLTGERCLALFPAGTIARDPHHHESPKRLEQGLNLCRT